jgi:molecular chaperone GrpE
VPEDKSVPETAAELAGAGETDLESAMQEAMAAVEAREAPAAPKPSAQDAVTEALIAAKKELESVLAQTQKEAEHMRERWLRAAADFENYKKRAAREREETVKYGNERLLKDFLPVVDDLELALDAAGRVDDKERAADQLMEGIRLVVKKFVGQLEKHGVATYDAMGEAFDPNLHEAVQQEHGDMDAGKVVRQLQRGFKLNERLLRPAMVVVSLGSPPGQK